MSRKTPIDLFAELEAYINAVDKCFVDKHLPVNPEVKPSEYEFDVKSYCVLTHAALEESVEEIALFTMERTRDAFLTGSFKAPLMAILSYHKKGMTIVEDEKQSQERCFDQIRKTLDDFKARFSVEIKRNHGFSLPYLRSILTPVYIDVPNDPILLASLSTLASARGAYAHTRGEVEKIPAPESIKDTVHDCLELVGRIAKTSTALVT